jgi:hypothetical protein
MNLLEPLLPVHVNTHRFGGGRPRVPDRQCASMCCAQWAALNRTGLFAKSTAYDRFLAAGVCLKLWQVGVERFDELKGID